MNMKTLVLFKYSVLFLCLCGVHLNGFAQSTREAILEDIARTGGVYYAYPVKEAIATPPPKGYKPFYISHYARHGSRWIQSEQDYKTVVDIFEKAHQAGALTALGEDVRKRMALVWEDAEGHGGDLTPLGVRQHRGIAERMFQNYPEVFKGSPALSARSTVVLRCVLSMDAFCERLKELNPALQIRREACARYMKYMNYHTPEAVKFVSHQGPWYEEYRKFKESHTRPDRLVTSLFNSPDYIRKNVNPGELMWGLYWIASDMQDVELPLSFYDLFEKEELFGIWQSVNYRMYICNANAPVNQGAAPKSAKSLLKNIIESADRAIREGTPCATLRFGHDTNLIRLLALMQVEGCSNQETDPDRYYLAWQDFRVSPMGANLQLIFFKNKQGEVIVKLLHNENEVKLPIDSPIAPYYKWETVKAFYNHL